MRDETSERSNGIITSDNFFSPLIDIHTPVFTQGAIDFQGIAHTLDASNPNVFPILRGSEACYSHKREALSEEEMESPRVAGAQLSLVSGYQSRSNHRAVFSGSLDMCSDELLAQSPDNEKFCAQLINWAMQESGVLRSTGLRHFKEGTEAGERNPENYDLESRVEFQIDLQ